MVEVFARLATLGFVWPLCKNRDFQASGGGGGEGGGGGGVSHDGAGWWADFSAALLRRCGTGEFYGMTWMSVESCGGVEIPLRVFFFFLSPDSPGGGMDQYLF